MSTTPLKVAVTDVAADTLGRGAIEALRVDHANHILATAQRLDLTDRVPGRRHRLVLATPQPTSPADAQHTIPRP